MFLDVEGLLYLPLCAVETGRPADDDSHPLVASKAIIISQQRSLPVLHCLLRHLHLIRFIGGVKFTNLKNNNQLNTCYNNTEHAHSVTMWN